MFKAKHLDFVGRLYDLALNPDGWRPVLDEFCTFIDAGGASLHVMDHFHDAATVTDNGGRLTPAILERYNQLYAATDAEALSGLFASPKREFLHDFELLGLTEIREIESHPPLKWLHEQTGLFWRVASRLNVTGAWLDVIAFQFERDHGPMSAQEKAFCGPFMAHFAKVVELGRAFRILEARFRAVLDALDRLNIGVFITLGDGQLVLRNREADRIIDLADGVSVDQGRRLVIAADQKQREFARAVSETSATAASEGDRPEVLLSVARKSGADPFLLAVSPLRDDGTTLEAKFRGAIVFAIDPENRKCVSSAGMEKLYSLSPAEADVLSKLLGGQKAAEIAEARNTSQETVRSQIKSVLSKTNTNKQSDLIRLAVSVNLPIGDDG